ncbi:MAG: hypothetical protein FWE09_08450 [Treponema sp.]|nr:hypothetical protein [Treponema sp.]
MQKIRALAVLLALCHFSLQAALAQEADDDWGLYMVDVYSLGDQTFSINAGVIFPTVFSYRDDADRPYNHGFRQVGGAGSLAYTVFLGPNLYVGAEIGIRFIGTVAETMLIAVPIGLRAGWQFTYRRFEFPVGLVFGLAPQNHGDERHLGLFLGGGGAAFFRFSPSWSFGLNADWTWFPQRPRVDGKRLPEQDADGNFAGVTLSARYHF